VAELVEDLFINQNCSSAQMWL